MYGFFCTLTPFSVPTAEKNRLLSAAAPIRKRLRTHITWLERELQHTNTNLAEAIR